MPVHVNVPAVRVQVVLAETAPGDRIPNPKIAATPEEYEEGCDDRHEHGAEGHGRDCSAPPALRLQGVRAR